MTAAEIPVGWGGVSGVLLFRALDVVKPYSGPSARTASRAHGGPWWMADDAMAAVTRIFCFAARIIWHPLAVVRAEVIAVGSECVTPTPVDTNSLLSPSGLNE